MDPFHDYRFWMCMFGVVVLALIVMASEQQENAQRIWNYCTDNYSVEYAKNYCGVQPYLVGQKAVGQRSPFEWAERLANKSNS